MVPKNASSLFSLSLTVEASEPHVARVTFRLTITRITDLITVKAKRQKNSIMLYNSLGQLNYYPVIENCRPTTIENRVVYKCFTSPADRHCHSARRANEAVLVIA